MFGKANQIHLLAYIKSQAIFVCFINLSSIWGFISLILGISPFCLFCTYKHYGGSEFKNIFGKSFGREFW